MPLDFWKRKDCPVSEMSIREYAKIRDLSPMNPDTLRAYVGELKAEYGLAGEPSEPRSREPELEPEVDEDAEDEAFKDDLDKLLEKKAALESKRPEAEDDGSEPKYPIGTEKKKRSPFINSWPGQ